MGGIGSGKWVRLNAKTKIGSVLEIDIKKLRKAGALAAGCSGSLDNGFDSVNYATYSDRFQLRYNHQSKPVVEDIYFTRYSSNIQSTDETGQITMFSCPDCQRRTETVYLCKGHFTCSSCANMSYPSQSENAHGKVQRKLNKLRTKLNPNVGYRRFLDLRLEESELSLKESELRLKQIENLSISIDRMMQERR